MTDKDDEPVLSAREESKLELGTDNGSEGL